MNTKPHQPPDPLETKLHPPQVFREEVLPIDVQAVGDIVRSTGFFSPAEVEIAVELVEERLNRGLASGYHFVFLDYGGRTIGYSCYGPIAGTVGSFDLYWIAIHEDQRYRGAGRSLLKETEDRIRAAGGRLVVVETSSREQYKPTRVFYERAGYHQEALLRDFYDVGDGKVIYFKDVSQPLLAEGRFVCHG